MLNRSLRHFCVKPPGWCPSLASRAGPLPRFPLENRFQANPCPLVQSQRGNPGECMRGSSGGRGLPVQTWLTSVQTGLLHRLSLSILVADPEHALFADHVLYIYIYNIYIQIFIYCIQTADLEARDLPAIPLTRCWAAAPTRQKTGCSKQVFGGVDCRKHLGLSRRREPLLLFDLRKARHSSCQRTSSCTT